MAHKQLQPPSTWQLEYRSIHGTSVKGIEANTVHSAVEEAKIGEKLSNDVKG